MSAGIACAPACCDDLALEREAANWQATAADRPSCPDCGRTLIRRGRQPRHAQNPRRSRRSRSHAATATVPPVRKVFSPLDKQLALLPGRFTPLLTGSARSSGCLDAICQSRRTVDQLYADFCERIDRPTADRSDWSGL